MHNFKNEKLQYIKNQLVIKFENISYIYKTNF